MSGVILAASSTAGDASLWWLWVVLFAWLAYHAVSALIWPYTACSACNGQPRIFAGDGENYRLCRKYGGSGRRRRLGARLLGRG